MNCEKCRDRFSQQQHKAINEYAFYCQKYCTPMNKYVLSLLEKKRLYFDIANCLFLINDDLVTITSIFNAYSYWTSLTITSSSRYMAESIKIKVLNAVLSLVKTNLTKYNSIRSLSLLHLPLTSNRTLALIYSILLHNKSLVELNVQHCSFTFSNNSNTATHLRANNGNLSVNTSSNVLSMSSSHAQHTHHSHHSNSKCKCSSPKHSHKKAVSSLNTACGFYATKRRNDDKRSSNTSHQSTSPSTPSPCYAFKSIFQSIYSHPSIQSLSFANNSLPDEDSSCLITMMVNQHNKQKTKNWSHTLHTKFTLSSLPLKYDLYALCHVDFSHNKLGSVFAKEMSRLLSSDIYLRKLDLSYNDFQHKECQLLCRAVKSNRFIVNLNLNCNPGLTEKIYIKLLLHLGKNIKYLKWCWDKGEYTENEFKRLIIEHVDKEMFQVDVNVPGSTQNDVNDDCAGANVNATDNNNDKQYNYEEALEKIRVLEEENRTLKSKMSSSNKRCNAKQKGKKRTKSVGFF